VSRVAKDECEECGTKHKDGQPCPRCFSLEVKVADDYLERLAEANREDGEQARKEHDDRIRAEAAAEERRRIVLWLRAAGQEHRQAAREFTSIADEQNARADECESRAAGIELAEHVVYAAQPQPGGAAK